MKTRDKNKERGFDMERRKVIKILESKGYKMSKSELSWPSSNDVTSFSLKEDNTFVLYSGVVAVGEYTEEMLEHIPRAVSYTFAGSFTKGDINDIYLDELDLSNAPDERRFDIIQKRGYIVKIFYNQEKEVYKVSYRKNPKVKEERF